jgi:hypothetical protein
MKVIIVVIIVVLLVPVALSLSPHPHGKSCLNMNMNMDVNMKTSRFLASAVVGISIFLPNPMHCSGGICGGCMAAALATSPVVGDVKTDDGNMITARRAWYDLFGRVTDTEIAVVELKQDVKTIIKDLADTKTQILVVIVLFSFIFNKRMDDDKAEANKRMDEAKAESNKRMDATDTRMLVMFVITSGIAAAAILK